MAGITIMCARSMHIAVGTIAESFAAATGHAPDLQFGTVGALQERLDGGETPDVLVLSAPMMASLEQAGALRPDTRRDVARTFVAVCVREGERAPAIGTVAEFEAALRAAPAVAVSDPGVGGSAGIYLAKLFETMGIADMMQAKGLPQKTGAEVARRVAEGTASMGLTLSGEVAGVPGAVIAGPLPAPIGSETTYTAAVMRSSAEPEAAMAFIAALTGPAVRELWLKAGFEVP